MNDNVLFAFLLTLLAGLSTGIGSLIALFSSRTNRTFLSVALGFSSGVMIYVSFVEIFAQARDKLTQDYSHSHASWITVLSFFGGMAVITIIDRLVPSYENPHEPRNIEEMGGLKEVASIVDRRPAAPGATMLEERKNTQKHKLLRMGMLSAVAIGIHNFPEGLAAFISALTDPSIGIPIAIAIALHNIPEGISVSVPIYYATGSRKKAFWFSFLSGVSEPVGAVLGYLVLRPFVSPTLFGILFASVAGIMVFISMDELFPTAKEYGKGHAAVYGLISGMAVMALSLLLFL